MEEPLTFFHLTIHRVLRINEQAFVNLAVLELYRYHMVLALVQEFDRYPGI